MEVGRPTSYKQEYCQMIIECFSRKGSVVQFAKEIGVAKSTIYEWIDNFPEFSDAFNKGKAISESDLISQGQKALDSETQGKDFNVSLWKYLLYLKHGITEKKELALEHTGKEGGPIEINKVDLEDRLSQIKGKE